MRKKVLTTLLVMGWLLLPTAIWAQSEPEPTTDERWPPCIHEMIAMATLAPPETPPLRPPDASCPCFDVSTLTALPGSSWDVCVEGTFVAQAAAWFGKSSAEGKEGYNLLVAKANERSPEPSCQLLHRFRVGGEMQQDYRRIVNITDAEAEICWQVLVGWMQSRGGCSTVVKRRR